MRRLLFITALVILQLNLFSQYAEEALRYSQIYYQGTARNMAVGGAMGAMGGDFSVLSTNPGGLAIFRSNDFSISLEGFSRKVSSDYNNSMADASKSMFDISNIGYVISKQIGRSGRGWKYWQLGFGMNRLNNYNTSATIIGPSNGTSKLDVYQAQANGVEYQLIEDTHGPYAFDLSPAWWTYLLDTIPGYTDLYYIPLDSGGVMQTQTTNIKGSNNEFLVSGSANFDDILYLGATLGLPYLRYIRESIYAESDPDNLHSNLNNWSQTENIETTGWGVNFKIGAIVRPIDWIRIGLSFHTPTYYFSMKDKWYTYTYANYTGNDQYTAESPDGEYKYKLTTPMRFIGSLGFVIKEIGFISGEYEYAGYNQSKFKAKDYGFDAENDDIQNSFKGVGNIRVGTEWRIMMVSLRAGYALYGSPYKDELNDGQRQSISGGIGYRGDNFSIDFAYVRSTMNEDYYLYSYSDPENGVDIQSDVVKNTFTDQNFVLTFRYFFKKK